MLMRHGLTLLLAAGLSLLAGCTNTASSSVHGNVAQGAKAPHTVILLPVDIDVKQLDALGNLEPEPKSTAAANSTVDRVVRATLTRTEGHSVQNVPALTPEQQALLDEHQALYKLLIKNRLAFGGQPLWAPAQKRQTLGNGLAFLAADASATAGADVAVLVSGEDVRQTGGRIATSILMAAAFGVAIPGGWTYLDLGMVDLRTGSVLWSITETSSVHELDDPAEAQTLLDAMFKESPFAVSTGPNAGSRP